MNLHSPEDKPGLILVVDDELINRELLMDLLESQGHQVILAEHGEQALKMAAAELPDVILLDVMMPGMNGFEVCRALKADSVLTNIPVLLTTALADRNNRLQGIEAGANDFLTKPLDLADAGLRVRNAVRSRRLYEMLERRNAELQELALLRDNLTNMLVHDLKSPLAAIMGYIKIVQTTGAARLEGKEKDFLARSLSSGQRMLEMVTSLLDIGRLETGELTVAATTVDMVELISSTLESAQGLFREVTLDWQPPAGLLRARCDAELVRRILTNLVDNAVKYARTRVEVSLEPGLRVSVRDDGKGIPPEFHQRIFEKFGQVDGGKRYSTGLGLTFCKLAVEAQGGQIGLESQVDQGTRFWFTLPEG